jgi:DNA-binding MarR family transcriptional regulator
MEAMPSARTVTLDAADLAARLRVSVWRLARRMRQASDPGVTPTVLAALSTVEHQGPLTAGQLATHEQVTKPTMTRTISMLIEQGLVARTADPLDGRVTWLKITPAGSKLLQRMRRRSDEYLAKRVKALDAADREVLEDATRILERLAEPDR